MQASHRTRRRKEDVGVLFSFHYRLILPEHRLDAQLTLALDQAADVVAEELAQDFVLQATIPPLALRWPSNSR
jgi:hypothetical protein